MKKLFLLLISIILTIGAFVYASHPWMGKALPAVEVQQRWGKLPFIEEKFKNGDQKIRAAMAYSLITSGSLKGLSTAEIRNRLGDFDGHYFSESFPTYLIQEAKKQGEDTWQLVFLIDKNQKTTDVIVHKNCCY